MILTKVNLGQIKVTFPGTVAEFLSRLPRKPLKNQVFYIRTRFLLAVRQCTIWMKVLFVGRIQVSSHKL